MRKKFSIFVLSLGVLSLTACGDPLGSRSPRNQGGAEAVAKILANKYSQAFLTCSLYLQKGAEFDPEAPAATDLQMDLMREPIPNSKVFEALISERHVRASISIANVGYHYPVQEGDDGEISVNGEIRFESAMTAPNSQDASDETVQSILVSESAEGVFTRTISISQKPAVHIFEYVRCQIEAEERAKKPNKDSGRSFGPENRPAFVEKKPTLSADAPKF